MSDDLGAAWQVECEHGNSGEPWVIMRVRKNR
jgi:hypothetical protein